MLNTNIRLFLKPFPKRRRLSWACWREGIIKTWFRFRLSSTSRLCTVQLHCN